MRQHLHWTLPEMLSSKLTHSTKAESLHGLLNLHSPVDLQAARSFQGGLLLSGHCSFSCWGIMCKALQKLSACSP